MPGQLRILRAFGLAASLLLVAGAERAAAVAYTATIINSVGFDNPSAYGISGTSIVGAGNASSGDINAILWNSATNSVVSLNPGVDWGSQGEDVSGTGQVGHGSGITTGGNEHALL